MTASPRSPFLVLLAVGERHPAWPWKPSWSSPSDAPQSPRVPLGIVSTDEIPDLYRATNPHRPDWDEQGTIHSRRWVESSLVWPSAVAGIDDPQLLVRLSLERDNLPPPVSLEKLIAEAVFERVRQGVVPEAPSRLNCVFVALDVYGAADFAGEQSGEPIIDPATGDVVNWPILRPVSTGGRPWIAVDMRLFSMHPQTAVDQRGIVDQLERLDYQAHAYWRGKKSAPDPLIELLVEAVDLPGLMQA